MKSCIFVLLIVYCATMTCQKNDDYYNVGTVLFSRSDLQKKRWNKKEVQLLEARRHFQDLLPPPNFVSAEDPNSINSLLEYFKDAYSAVKREAKDEKTDNIMTAAMSDVLGGYLKLWALPITKFSYYGGTANQDDALRLYDLYDEIKSYLNTNGRGWRNPNSNLLHSVSINIASPHTQSTRETYFPCDNLALFEKTQSGFNLPMPSIDWSHDGETMFVPLKNEPLISLKSPNNSGTLFKYYDTAKNCLSNKERKEFDENFQKWLNMEIIPHLNDEKLYPALGSVLTLVNKTRHLCDTVIDVYNENLRSLKDTKIAGIPIDLSSKKMIILIIIIVLEIVWCIPAVCYLFCTKCKKKKNKYSNVYMYVDHPQNKQNMRPPYLTKSEHTSTVSNNRMNNSCDACFDEKFILHRNRSQALNYPQTQEKWRYDFNTFLEKDISNHSLINKLENTNSEIRKMNFTTLNEIPEQFKKHNIKLGISKKTGTNKVFAKETSTFSYPDIYSCSIPTADNIAKPESYPTMQQLEATKTVTLLKFKDLDPVHNEISEVIRDEKDTQMCLPVVISKCNQSIEKSSKTTMVEPPSTDLKLIKTQTQKDLRKKGVRVATGKPYLEITIDNRPQRDATEHVSFDLTNHKNKHGKPSKIPKRKFNNSEAQTYRSELTKKAQNQFSKRKSCIPQPTPQRTKDDLNITDKKTSNKKSKLNTTF